MRIALMFPGQGAQYVGMGRELYEQYPEVRRLFAEAEEALELPLAELCFNGPEERLEATEITQPAILTVSIAALVALEAELGRPLRPVAVQPLALAWLAPEPPAPRRPLEKPSTLQAVKTAPYIGRCESCQLGQALDRVSQRRLAEGEVPQGHPERHGHGAHPALLFGNKPLRDEQARLGLVPEVDAGRTTGENHAGCLRVA